MCSRPSRLPWFDLGESDPDAWKKFVCEPSANWAKKFVELFPFIGVEEHEVQSVHDALYNCWGKMSSGEADVPKEWAKKKQQFQDVTAVLGHRDQHRR